MSLPQRKKSAEEIAKLRESLGIVAPPLGEEDLAVDATKPENQPESESLISQPVSAIKKTQESAPFEEIHTPELINLLKHSEPTAVLPVEGSGPSEPLPTTRQNLPVSTPLPTPSSPKVVRSLRKSEQGPRSAVQAPALDSRLPIHRHSDEQLNRIRRQQALSQPAAPLQPQSLAAQPLLVIPGYLFALAGGACFGFYDIEKQHLLITVSCVIAALSIATFIFLKKPLLRHHAAFIAVVSLFVIVFGALYYFPQLQHGT
jgi:hypothetical protein